MLEAKALAELAAREARLARPPEGWVPIGVVAGQLGITRNVLHRAVRAGSFKAGGMVGGAQ